MAVENKVDGEVLRLHALNENFQRCRPTNYTIFDTTSRESQFIKAALVQHQRNAFKAVTTAVKHIPSLSRGVMVWKMQPHGDNNLKPHYLGKIV